MRKKNKKDIVQSTLFIVNNQKVL